MAEQIYATALDDPFSAFQIILRGLYSILGFVNDEIDQNQSFTSLGGDSLAALLLSKFCRERGYTLSPGNILRSPNISGLRAHIFKAIPQQASNSARSSDSLSENNTDGLTRIDGVYHRSEFSMKLPRVSYNSVKQLQLQYPHVFTEMQAYLIQGTMRNPCINIIKFWETYPTRHLHVLKESWTKVLRLGSVFQPELSKAFDIQWTEITVTTEDEYELEVSRPPLLSDIGYAFRVVTLSDIEATPPISTIIWQVHHSYIDGYSASLLYKKVRRLANGFPTTPGPSFSSVIQRVKDHQQNNRAAAERYWATQYARFSSAIGVIDSAFPLKTKSTKPRNCIIDIQLPQTQVRDYSKQIGVTPSSLYCSAWGLTLSKLVNSDQVYFGMIFSGRDLPISGVEDVIGSMISSLPFFVSTKPDSTSTASDLVKKSFDQLLKLSAIQSSEPRDGFKRNFGSLLATQFEMEYQDENNTIQPIACSHFEMLSDIPLSVLIGGTGNCTFCFHKDKFTLREIELVGELFHNALLALMVPQRPLLECLNKVNSNKDQRKLLSLSNFNSTGTFKSSKNQDLVTLFERNVKMNPECIAVAQGEKSLTYRELNHRASMVARALDEFHVTPGEVVCVYAERSINWIIAIYGILKVEAVYAPLDPSAPASVQNINFSTSGARIWTTPSISHMAMMPIQAEHCLDIEKIGRSENLEIGSQDLKWRDTPTPEDAAYVCFTSGSTGRPKAVCCTHMGLVAFQKDQEVRLFADVGQTVAQIMSPAFDGSIHEIFSALSYGATLRLPDGSSDDLFAHLHKATSTILTPSLAKALNPSDYPNLENVYLVGEPVPQIVCDDWAVGRRLFNMYGPTEGTCGATIKRLLPQQLVTIGRPNPSTRVYILDRNMHLMPMGVIGFIYLAGIQVSRGYINQPEETARAFSRDSIVAATRGCNTSDEQMYNTGDRGFWNPDTHEVHCLGRADRQIKLQGFRLDLNDLEIRIINAVPGCIAAAVARKDDHLVAVLQPASLEISSLRPIVSKALPPYAMPRYMYSVDRFPLSPAGKLDYSALVNSIPVQNGEETKSFRTKMPGMSSTERTVAKLWQALLQHGTNSVISPDSDFISLGGNSLLQIQLANMLSTHFKKPITMKMVIENSILQDLATIIEKNEVSNSCENQLQVEKSLPLTVEEDGVSPIEEYWFWKYQANLGTSSFNVSYACDLDPCLIDLKRLVDAWNQVLGRHRVFRSRYIIGNCGSVERTYSDKAPCAQFRKQFDLRREINIEFNLGAENPIRVIISESRMLLCVSHIICDLTTLRHILVELHSLYTNDEYINKPVRSLEETTYNREPSSTAIAFWREYLHDIPNQAFEHRRRSYKGRSLIYRLPDEAAVKVVDLTEKYSLTLHQTALSLVFASLQQFNGGRSDMVLGSPFLNRGREDMESIGLFLQPLPICIRIPFRSNCKQNALTTSQLLKSIRQASQSALSNALSWNQLLHCLGDTSSLSSLPPSCSIITPLAVTSTGFSSSSLSLPSDLVSLTPSSSPLTTSPVSPTCPPALFPLPPDHSLFDVMVTFHDDRNSNNNNSYLLQLPGSEKLVTWADGSKFSVMFEFTLLPNDTLLLRIEYDDDLFATELEVDRLQLGVVTALDCFMKGMAWGGVKDAVVKASNNKMQKNQANPGEIKDPNDTVMIEFGSRFPSPG